jgi:hypothetical protein
MKRPVCGAENWTNSSIPWHERPMPYSAIFCPNHCTLILCHLIIVYKSKDRSFLLKAFYSTNETNYKSHSFWIRVEAKNIFWFYCLRFFLAHFGIHLSRPGAVFSFCGLLCHNRPDLVFSTSTVHAIYMLLSVLREHGHTHTNVSVQVLNRKKMIPEN